MSKTRRVLVIRFSALGDVLLTFPSLKHLVDQGCEIHFLTKDAFRPVVELAVAPGHVRVHAISNHATLGELCEKARVLKALDFDAVYDLHRNLRSRIASFIIARPTRRAWKFRFRELFLYVFRKGLFNALGLRAISRPAEALRVVEADVSTTQRLLGNSELKRAPLPVENESARVRELRQRFAAHGYVCIAVESAWRQKEWSVERFIEVARRVVARGVGVVWIGLRDVPGEAKFEGTFDLTKGLAITEVADILANARGLLCNDSGLMHLAEAVGTPVAAIFGPTSRELGFAPRLPASRIVQAELWCRPCSKTGRLCIRPIARRKCLSDVSVEQAWAAVDEILGSVGARR